MLDRDLWYFQCTLMGVLYQHCKPHAVKTPVWHAYKRSFLLGSLLETHLIPRDLCWCELTAVRVAMFPLDNNEFGYANNGNMISQTRIVIKLAAMNRQTPRFSTWVSELEQSRNAVN